MVVLVNYYSLINDYCPLLMFKALCAGAAEIGSGNL